MNNGLDAECFCEEFFQKRVFQHQEDRANSFEQKVLRLQAKVVFNHF